jgi:hypothetical protein
MYVFVYLLQRIYYILAVTHKHIYCDGVCKIPFAINQPIRVPLSTTQTCQNLYKNTSFTVEMLSCNNFTVTVTRYNIVF